MSYKLLMAKYSWHGLKGRNYLQHKQTLNYFHLLILIDDLMRHDLGWLSAYFRMHVMHCRELAIIEEGATACQCVIVYAWHWCECLVSYV